MSPDPDTDSIPVIVVLANSLEGGQCRGCRALLTWAITYPMHKRIPLTAPARIVRRTIEPDGTRLAHIDRAAVHFATCPQRDRFRRGAKP